METVFRARGVSVIAVIFSAVGAVLMFIVGAVTTINAIGAYFGTGEAEAFSTDAALEATVDVVSSLDQFLLGLVLLLFAYGVYRLFVVENAEAWEQKRQRIKAPDWLGVTTVTELKVSLLEVTAVLLAVLFLKGILKDVDKTAWPDLVVPIAVGILGLTIWLIRNSEDH
jgi:uncharacterized membrane protein YqhA